MAQVTVRPSGQSGDYLTLAAALSASETDILFDGSSYALETANHTISVNSTSILATGTAKVTGARHISGSPGHARFADSSGGHVFRDIIILWKQF